MKSFVLRWAVLFIAANVFGFVVHRLLLQGDYTASPQLLRTQEDANRHFVYMLVGFRLFVCGAGLDLRSRYSISALARSRTPLWLLRCGC